MSGCVSGNEKEESCFFLIRLLDPPRNLKMIANPLVYKNVPSGTGFCS